MARIFGILLFVLALWFMAAQYGGGPGGAAAPDADGEARVRPTDRVRESVLRAQAENEERRRKLIEP